MLVLEAARVLFVDRGYEATRIDDIAARAGVSSPTIYAVFGSKRGLLDALISLLDASAGASDARARLLSATTAYEQLAIMVHFDRSLFERGADIIAAAHSAGASEPELAEMLAEGKRRGRSARSQVVDSWAGRQLLAPGRTPHEVKDVLAVLSSHEVYLELVRGSGWTPDRYESWLLELLAQWSLNASASREELEA